jgi:F0F1-type ATP synthase membrane subunit b/b'
MGLIVFITLVIAVVALILAYKAYTRSGGTIEEMRSSINEIGHSTEKVRKMAADALAKVEKSIRGEKASQADSEAPAEGSDADENQK